MMMEREWVGDVEVPTNFGVEVHQLQADGFELRNSIVDGWMLPVLESRRIADRECPLEATLTSSASGSKPFRRLGLRRRFHSLPLPSLRVRCGPFIAPQLAHTALPDPRPHSCSHSSLNGRYS
jgi:hypothetical protein